MKSKDSGGKVQGSVTSSTSNMQFGGTHSGWMGERSIPVTVAEGNASAMSLPRSTLEKDDIYFCRELKDLHRPYPSSGSNIEYILVTLSNQ
jgi:hypothetical protein